MKILIVGMGSIGRRHAENFAKLGCEIGAVDTNLERVKEAQLKTPILFSTDELKTALDHPSLDWDGVVIATPPAFHVDQFKDIKSAHDCNILMEKNLCLDFAECETMDESLSYAGKGVLMGYTWRWWKNIEDVKTLLPKIGDIKQVQMTMSAHLADWHPYEPIEQFYAAERGGVLNEAHWHDIMLWFWGMPNAVYASYDKISSLPLETPDVLDSIFYYDDFRVNLHYDLYKRPHDRSMKIVGERGTLEWMPNLIRVSNVAKDGWVEYPNSAERNDMFMSMAEDFLGLIRNGWPPKCALQDGINVMKLLDYSKQSNETGCKVEIT